MKPKLTTPLLAAIGAVVLMVTLFFSFYLSTTAYRTDSGPEYPPQSADTPALPEAQDPAQPVLQDVTVTTENVQDVIASLTRPAAYSYTVKNTLFYGDASHVLTRKQYFKNGACRTEELSAAGSVQRVTLRRGEKLYAWENGETRYYTGAVGAFTEDGDAMLPTYETVLDLPPESLTGAALQTLAYEPTIYVSSEQDGWRSEFYVSAVSGLLRRADIYEGDRLVRSLEISDLTQEAADAYFLLPGGASVFDS